MEQQVDPVELWINRIAVYEREFKGWQGRTRKILKKYRDDSNQDKGTRAARFNILWSNVQTAVPAVFSRLPQPDVSRRHKDNDPVGRVAGLILERGLEFEVNHYPDYRAAMNNCVLDRFLGGRGVAWVRYEPHIRAVDGTPQDGVQITEDKDEAAAVEEEIEYECAPTDYVHWEDFGHVVARTWEEVPGVWRKVYMGEKAWDERFPEYEGQCPLDTKPPDQKKESTPEQENQALVYEIWDKENGKALWFSKSLGKFLDEREDPLGLENFWPCPRPLFATLTSDSLVPVPDYTLYQDQARILDVLEDRIEGLIDALQIKGVYDAGIPELARLFTEGQNGSLIPVKNWAAFAEKAGLKGALDIVDLTPIFMALKEAYAAVDEQKNQIYEITGLADIIRGSTDPRETAAAQKQKGRFGSMRLRDMQGDVAQFATELLQIKAQIMCKHFQAETLAMIGSVETLNEADKQYIEPALQLLKNSTLRDFRIEVEADSMVQMDEQQEKEDRAEFLTVVGGYLEKAAAIPPSLAPMAAELLKFGVTGFKVGKSVEGALDQLIDQMKQAAAKPQQKPDPEMEKIKAETQLEQQRMQAKQQADQAQAQLTAQLEAHKQQVQAEQNQHQQQLESQRAQQQAQLDAQLQAHSEALKKQSDDAQRSFEAWKAQLDASTRITVANIGAKSKMDAAAVSAADQASDQAVATPRP